MTRKGGIVGLMLGRHRWGSRVHGFSDFQETGLASEGMEGFPQRCGPGSGLQDAGLASHHFHYTIIAHFNE